MEVLKDCPECGKQLSRSRKYCACGWKIAVLDEKKILARNCQYQTSSGPCKEIGSISPARMDGKWYCRDHWYIAVKERFNY